MDVVDLTDIDVKPDDRGASVDAVAVYGTGIPEVDGDYAALQKTTHNMVSVFVGREFLGRRLTIYRRCRTVWVIAAVPKNSDPNPHNDLDFFYANVERHNANFLRNANLPTAIGWKATLLSTMLRVGDNSPRVTPTVINFEAALGRAGGFEVLRFREGITSFDICLICRETYKKGQVFTILPCLHTIHKGCLDALYPTDRNVPADVKCPNCLARHPIIGGK